MVEVSDQLAGALLEITTRLVGDADAGAVLELVTGACVDVVGATASGVLTRDPLGGVRVVAASDERAAFVTVLEAQYVDGPSLDCLASGATAGSQDLGKMRDAWPQFVPAAVAAGVQAVYAVPMRLDGDIAGALNLLFTSRVTLDGPRLRLCQILADLAVLGLAQERDGSRSERVFERTLKAVNDRLSLGHAIGLVAGRLDVDVDTARAMIVHRARSTGSPILDVVSAITDGTGLTAGSAGVVPGQARGVRGAG
jgi:hypothetical protein